MSHVRIHERSRRHFLRVLSAAAAASVPLFNAKRAEAACKILPTGEEACNCMVSSTRILTESGPVPVEQLRIGDGVATESGVYTPIKWIGRRRLAQPLPGLDGNLPVRILRSAISDNIPSRDLFISPGHALFIDGYLIPVRYLVNGTTITQVTPDEFESVEYFHLELDRHEVMFAEGVALESLQVTGPHSGFDNALDYALIYGSDDPAPMLPYAPVLGYYGGKQEAIALFRLAVSRIVDVRDPIQVAYDRIEGRAEQLLALRQPQLQSSIA